MQILADIRLLGRGGVSGIEEYTRNLLTSLLTADKSNSYTLFYNGLRSKPLNFQTKIINWRIPNKLFDMSTRFLGWPAIDKIVKTDLVFSPHFNILKTAKAPRIVTFHDLSFLHHPYFFSRRQRFWHWLQNSRAQAREATHLIAVSEFTKRDLVESLGIPEKKISVVYSGVGKEFQPVLKARLAEFRKARGLERPFLLYLGALEPRKNIPAIIRAFAALKRKREFGDLRLVLAGR